MASESSNVSDGVAYCFTRQSSSSVVHQPPPLSPCSFMEVNISNNDDSLHFPCFACSGFTTIEHYHNDFRSVLADSITNAVVLPSPHCAAAAIARDILRSVLIPAANNSHADGSHRVELMVHAPTLHEYEDDGEEDEYYEDEEEDEGEEDEYYEDEEEDDGYYEEEDEDDVSRVLGESFEEAGPQRKPCKIDSVIEMLIERIELHHLEGDKAESDWKESGTHDCVICIEEIELIWDSLKMPCSHVFHKDCLSRWLDENHVCPLCRFELPLQDQIDA